MTIAPERNLQAKDTLMFSEAASAASVVCRQCRDNAELLRSVGKRLRELDPAVVLTCARGSSDHAATYAKYLIETRLGVPVSSFAPSISSVYHTKPKLAGALFIAISQSGKSPDLLAATQAAKDAGATVIAVVNVEDAPLAELADEVIPMRAGPEVSVAATKSYIATLAALVHLVAEWSGDDELHAAHTMLDQQLQAAWALDWSAAEDALRDAINMFVIGRGLGYGVAQEAALKFKETTGIHAESHSAAEVRHGPMAIVGNDFPVLVFAQHDSTEGGVTAVIEDFVKRGARVLLAGADQAGTTVLPWVPGVHAVMAPIVLVQSFYKAVNAIAVARGLDPDNPPHLHKVTETV